MENLRCQFIKSEGCEPSWTVLGAVFYVFAWNFYLVNMRYLRHLSTLGRTQINKCDWAALKLEQRDRDE
uniref:Uncharacterized protein n=1 Tax=Echinococcus granulosus TaxID=6210 RepID=A0A068WCH4_ECHGR|nr:hypothetical protein EgrG_000776100 [Echinococcus granulosus]